MVGFDGSFEIVCVEKIVEYIRKKLFLTGNQFLKSSR